MKHTTVASANTANLLHFISTHMSSRPYYNHTNYEVTISDDFIITMTPDDIWVMPSRHRRKFSDRVWLLGHVVHAHMYDILVGFTNPSGVQVIPNTLVPGRYVYQSSFTNKQRRWIKVD